MGYSTRRTASVEVDVDFDLDNFDEEDIIDFLEGKGYIVTEHAIGIDNIKALDQQIWQLYLTYKSENGAGPQMDKELGVFFAEYYNKVSV
jgi:hypothetical protein